MKYHYLNKLRKMPLDKCPLYKETEIYDRGKPIVECVRCSRKLVCMAKRNEEFRISNIKKVA